MTTSPIRTTALVRVVGVGLLGTSVGQALTAQGIEVALADVSPATVALAADYGAGRPAQPGDDPQLIVVAVPPDVAAAVVAAELAAHPTATVTDVASVKSSVLEGLRAAGADLDRYVGSHPMAGRERGGAVAGRADLFVGRPWVVTADDSVAAERRHAVEDLARDLGAVVVPMGPREHDDAVALVSHLPQVVASLLAARLSDAPDDALTLAGAGLRDTTRIAGSDAALWVQILAANAGPVRDRLSAVRDDLDAAIAALADPDVPGARRTLAGLIAAGAAGVSRLPGKHGQSSQFAIVTVIIDDRPGQLAALLTQIGELGVNMEDLRLEHSPGAPIGFVEIAVAPETENGLVASLADRGWSIAEVPS